MVRDGVLEELDVKELHEWFNGNTLRDRDEVFDEIVLLSRESETLCSQTAGSNDKPQAAGGNDKPQVTCSRTDPHGMGYLARVIALFESYGTDPAPGDPALQASLQSLRRDANNLSTTENSPQDQQRFQHSHDVFLEHRGSYIPESVKTRRIFLGLRSKLTSFVERWKNPKDTLKDDDAAVAMGEFIDCCEERKREKENLSEVEFRIKLTHDLVVSLREGIKKLDEEHAIDPGIVNCLQQLLVQAEKLETFEAYTDPASASTSPIRIRLSKWSKKIPIFSASFSSPLLKSRNGFDTSSHSV
jgi:hypothetical protein